MALLRFLLVLVVICSLLTTVDAGKKKKKKKKSNREHEMFEGATDEALIMEDPVAIQARKMSHLLKRQDVVATCRYMLFKAYKSFYEAKHACEHVEWPFTHAGANLAYVKTQEENREIRILLQVAHGIKQTGHNFHRDNWVWVGLRKVLNNNKVLSKSQRGPASFNQTEWQWLDGTHPNFTHWMRSQPDQEKKRPYKGLQNYVQINKRGRWDDTFHEMEAPYACNYCGKYIVIAEHETWDKAKALCAEYGLTMAIVNSVKENQELAWAANLTFGHQPERKRWNDTNWIWLGTEEVLDEAGLGTGVWQHHDGSELSWKPRWDAKSQPDNWVLPKGEQTKAAFSRINHKWDDSFRWRKRPFACMCPHRTCHYPGSSEE